MRSWNVKVLLGAVCIAGATACSDADPSTGGGALTPFDAAGGASGAAGRGGSAGAAGSGGSGGGAGSNAGVAGSGGSAGGNASGGSDAGGSSGNAGSAGSAGAAGAAGTAGAAGAAGAGDEPGVPDAGAEPPAEEPPPEDVVVFSDVYGLLVSNCGGCHSGNPAYLPAFAQPDEAAASALVQPGGLADRIYARTVTDRTMPPACRGGDFGDPGCVSEDEAALLQAWADGGYQR